MGPNLAYQVVMETCMLPIVANVVMKPLACKVLPVKRTHLPSSPSLDALFSFLWHTQRLFLGECLLSNLRQRSTHPSTTFLQVTHTPLFIGYQRCDGYCHSGNVRSPIRCRAIDPGRDGTNQASPRIHVIQRHPSPGTTE